MKHGFEVPCGKCLHCRRKRVSGWAFRLMNQDRSADLSFFVTLTYDTDHLEFSTQGRPSLCPAHLTNFWKVFRKRFPPKSIKYYAVGEYGSNRKRPHYHAIIFVHNAKSTALEFINWIERDWPHGSTYCGSVSEESVAYTLKYISKPPSVPQYPGDTRIREFSRMSKGLGAEYLRNKKWHHINLEERHYLPLKSDGKASMPRYYKDKIYTSDERQKIGAYMAETMSKRGYNELKLAREAASIKLNKV